jgi:hypothetical protein
LIADLLRPCQIAFRDIVLGLSKQQLESRGRRLRLEHTEQGVVGCDEVRLAHALERGVRVDESPQIQVRDTNVIVRIEGVDAIAVENDASSRPRTGLFGGLQVLHRRIPGTAAHVAYAGFVRLIPELIASLRLCLRLGADGDGTQQSKDDGKKSA